MDDTNFLETCAYKLEDERLMIYEQLDNNKIVPEATRAVFFDLFGLGKAKKRYLYFLFISLSLSLFA